MSITNGYCTLAELKRDLLIGKSYTATTISFTNGATKTISDSALGLEMFVTGASITVSGSTSNDGTYTIATGGVAADIVTSEALPLTEVAGDTVIITDVSNKKDDPLLETYVDAASRAIDIFCGRRFYRNTVDETRYYTLDSGEYEDSTIFFCPDDLGVGTITSLKCDHDGDRTYEETWTATDYDLMPFNAAADGWPYTWLETTPQGDYAFSRMRKGIQIIGKFGFAATTPAPINRACIRWAAFMYHQKDTPVFDTTVIPEAGVITVPQGMPLDVKLLLAPYIRRAG